MSVWKNIPVLVTGAGGFIASHLVEQLVTEGANVKAFVRYNSRNDPGLLRMLPPGIQSRMQVIAGDLRDGEAVRAAAKDADTIFHLGAMVSIPYSYLHPREVIETNVLGTLNVLMAARDLGLRRIVHTSSSEVYGTAKKQLIDEAHPLQGQSPYSASKIAADKIVESFHRSFDLPVTTLRPFNTYGPRQSARAVIPTIITQALTSDAIRLGALEPERDFTFVDDTVRGFLQIGQCDAAVGREVNIGSGSCFSIGDIVQKILNLVGRDLTIICEEKRRRPASSEVMRLQADVRKARRLFGWDVQVPLDEGLKRTIAWIKEHLGHYRLGVYEV